MAVEEDRKQQTMASSPAPPPGSKSTEPISSDQASVVSNLSAPQSAKHLQQIKAANVASTGTSVGVTYASQDKLPRLPIPDLEETMERFQARLEALQDVEQRKETASVVDEFLKGDGPLLQLALKEYEAEGVESEEIGSYVEEFWNESYLSPDTSVVLNLNPFFVLEEGPDPKIAKDQNRRAASLCFAAIKMASVVRGERLKPDEIRGKPLCMDQFKALFGSSRQPLMDGCDDVHVYNDSCHVVVLCKNQFYYFTALWPGSGKVAVDETDVHDILVAIQKHASETDLAERSKPALGVFTSLPRSKWAAARSEISESEANRTALRFIDSALFVLVLDDFVPKDISGAAANVLHGTNQLKDKDTMQVGTCLNRWYDKLQLIVCSDGTSGLVFEHSIIDGHTALRFASDVYAESVIAFAESIVDLVHGRGSVAHVLDCVVERAAAEKDGAVLDILPKKLVFDLSDSILERIYYAETGLCDEIHACDTFVLEYKDYGKRLIKGNKMSPDAYVQMSILLAYYQLYGKVVCMYEPALTKQFFHGRTEAIRGATLQAKRLCEVWCDRKATKKEKLDALRAATVEHGRLTKESSMGLGVDRHLFALKSLAERDGMRRPKFFKSEAWKMLNHTVLSTSNCGNPALRLFGFGPVVPDGFGVGYIIKESAISYSVCSKHRQTRRYVRALRSTLNNMQTLLEPISSVYVGSKQRATLKHVREAITRQDSTSVAYGDFWGENNAIAAMKDGSDGLPPRQLRRQRTSSVSQYFSPIKEQSTDEAMLRVSDFTISVTLPESDSDEEKSTETWWGQGLV